MIVLVCWPSNTRATKKWPTFVTYKISSFLLSYCPCLKLKLSGLEESNANVANVTKTVMSYIFYVNIHEPDSQSVEVFWTLLITVIFHKKDKVHLSFCKYEPLAFFVVVWLCSHFIHCVLFKSKKRNSKRKQNCSFL